jgi:hypothetical protein
MKNWMLPTMAALVVALCVGVGLFLQSSPVSVDPSPVVKPESAPAPQPPAAEPEPEAVPKPLSGKSSVDAGKGKAKPAPAPLAPWEIKIDQLLTSNLGETETAQNIINMVPTLPPEGQVGAILHATNLLVDKEYQRLMPLVRNLRLPQEVHDVLMTDLMNRENKVKLPVLLEMARMVGHPHQEEAQTDLQIFLDADYGADWNKWGTALNEFLKKDAAETQPASN